ncbi:hypothetical protein TASIC1_0003018600 [Trichoderma asperellum]|uniref:Uncharacterized protein n=1 Tax=Trichoderma asperellum TaxID=101201 RepID=A0A6V8QRR5_TRIAP|nr:hypothetical protein TASIC1_0003018600 [Trichoderma asperellum]
MERRLRPLIGRREDDAPQNTSDPSPPARRVAVPELHSQRLLPILVSQSGFRWPKTRAQEGRTQGKTLEDRQGGGSFVRSSMQSAPAWYLSASAGQARAASTGT